MIQYLGEFLGWMKYAFRREATFKWFVVVFAGFVVRSDTLGVSSIVRGLFLHPSSYESLLHFFHSSAWNVGTLTFFWSHWLAREDVAFRVGDRILLLGDHTKTPKDGRRMPAVTTLHQDSETASKPSFFRGHHWGCVSLFTQAVGKHFSIPLLAGIHQGLEQLGPIEPKGPTMSVRIVEMALSVARTMHEKAYLVLDAFFATGPVFNAAFDPERPDEPLLHILTRAKRNVVAYLPPRARKKRSRGRPRKYGKKLKLWRQFDTAPRRFTVAMAPVYGNPQRVRHLTLDLLWKPIQRTLRFILIETPRGRIILMTSDLHIDAVTALQLYARRVAIETMFDSLKNTLGATRYHFWSKYPGPTSRRPLKRGCDTPTSSQPQQTHTTFDAIEKFMNVQLIVLGILQLLARNPPLQVQQQARCWLRTTSSETPSTLVSRAALDNTIKRNLHRLHNDPITCIIREKQEPSAISELFAQMG